MEAKFVNAREELNFGGPNFDIEDYAFVNLAAEYAITPRCTVFGRIDNLADEKYAEVFGFPALGRGAYGGMRIELLIGEGTVPPLQRCWPFAGRFARLRSP